MEIEDAVDQLDVRGCVFPEPTTAARQWLERFLSLGEDRGGADVLIRELEAMASCLIDGCAGRASHSPFCGDHNAGWVASRFEGNPRSPDGFWLAALGYAAAPDIGTDHEQDQ